jgi:hypothetical protein
LSPTPLKNDGVDDEIPNIWKVIKNVPNHQLGIENVLKYLKRRDHESPQIIIMIIYHKISFKKKSCPVTMLPLIT